MAEEKQYNKVVVVDENDNVIGAEMMFDAIEKGLLRSGARVYVFSESGRVLIQRRGKDVMRPLMLDQSAAGHVDEGETRLEAAVRELAEETGISGYPLKVVAEPFRSKGFINAIYKTVVPDNIQLVPEADEVEELFWLTVPELDELIKERPEECTPALFTCRTELRDDLITT